jgi:MoaA/NifB/PqqE/SkfB family radical SAM enzyme
MKANISPGYDKNRRRLADIVPISTPFTLFITPSQLCNFTCNYCTQSTSDEFRKRIGFQRQLLDYEVFSKIARQSGEFPEKYKRVLLTGLGEPLTNPKIARMIADLASLGVAEKYEIFTNASLLTHKMSDSLLEAGLTGLRISIQGLSAQKYKEICGVELDFGKLLENIRYFYEHRGHCRSYIKIIDCCLDAESDKQKFYDLFGEICDDIFIEHLVRAQPSMGDYAKCTDNAYTFYGEKSEPREICPYIFYTLQIDAAGNVFPCPPLGFPLSFSLGNVAETTLAEIWNGEKIANLRSAHLKKCRNKVPICDDCCNYLCFTPEADNLDNDAEAIIARIDAQRQEKK